jgi:hypothetical protein
MGNRPKTKTFKFKKIYTQKWFNIPSLHIVSPNRWLKIGDYFFV